VRRRPKQIKVEHIPTTLVDDKQFREFDKLIQLRPDSTVHANIVGRFCSGHALTTSTVGGGYGHMGCCSLLMIQQVFSVAPHDRIDVDYGGATDAPNISEVGCWYRDLLSLEPPHIDPKEQQQVSLAIEAQRHAELGQRAWSFDDPQRVAIDSLAQALKLEVDSIRGIKQTRAQQGRFVYEWKPDGKKLSYMMVVSRPYWLSFFASDPKKVAWIAVSAYETGCDKPPGVHSPQ
jgi:hypothetical protein